MRCGPRSVCRTRTAGAGLPGCACLLGTAGLRLPGYLCRAAPAACPTTWDRIFYLDGACARGLGGKAGPLARRIGRARSGGSARPTGRPPTCGLGRSSSSQRARPTGHTLRRHFHRIACSLSARPTGHRGCPSGTSTAPGRRTSQQCPARAAARSQPAFPSPFTAVLPRIVLRLPSQAAPVIQSTPRRR